MQIPNCNRHTTHRWQSAGELFIQTAENLKPQEEKYKQPAEVVSLRRFAHHNRPEMDDYTIHGDADCSQPSDNKHCTSHSRCKQQKTMLDRFRHKESIYGTLSQMRDQMSCYPHVVEYCQSKGPTTMPHLFHRFQSQESHFCLLESAGISIEQMVSPS